MARVFFSYSHKDEEYRDRLEVALKMLHRQGLVESWHDRRIAAGNEFAGEISQHLESADIILLLVSPDFLASDYCYEIEMGRAMERHHEGTARVVPVILRRSDWHHAPFGKLRATPTDGKPVRAYADLDDAFQTIAEDIRKAVIENEGKHSVKADADAAETRPRRARSDGPRSSNLTLAKTFTDRDRDRFLEETFDYIRAYFANSLEELKARNAGIDTAYRAGADRFSATIYKNGKEVSRCVVAFGNELGRGITYSNSDSGRGFNEQLRVDNDDYGLFIRSLGMASMLSGGRDEKLTQEGAAELYWSLLVNTLQGSGTY